MTESTAVSETIVCPGCHFGCRLVAYQCGRGKEFFDLATSGAEVPERRGPMLTPSERAALGGDGRPPVNTRVMHTLNIMANRLQQRHEEAGIRKVVLAIYRAGSFMSVPILIKRTLLQADEVMGILDEGQQEGLLAVETEDGRRTIARLTEKGTEQASAWKQEGDERTAEFLSTLSDEEKEELDRLGRKLLNMTVKRR